MECEGGEPVALRWIAWKILLSYLIAVTGSQCTIQLMEKWRNTVDLRRKMLLRVLASIALGGCGIWSMHFAGMNALELTLGDGSVLATNFDVGLTVLSLAAAIVGVFIGLNIASKDPFFLEVEADKRRNILIAGMAKFRIVDAVNRTDSVRRIKLIALFSRPARIVLGGIFTASGVLVMHYVGMWAQRSHACMAMSIPLVGLSALTALITASAAFWIVFRLSTFFAKLEALRVASALIMGIAVCGTHYVGMSAASYKYVDRTEAMANIVLFDGVQTAHISSTLALLFCFWAVSWSVTSGENRVISSTVKVAALGISDTGGNRTPQRAENIPAVITRQRKPLPNTVGSIPRQCDREVDKALDSILPGKYPARKNREREW